MPAGEACDRRARARSGRRVWEGSGPRPIGSIRPSAADAEVRHAGGPSAGSEVTDRAPSDLVIPTISPAVDADEEHGTSRHERPRRRPLVTTVPTTVIRSTRTVRTPRRARMTPTSSAVAMVPPTSPPHRQPGQETAVRGRRHHRGTAPELRHRRAGRVPDRSGFQSAALGVARTTIELTLADLIGRTAGGRCQRSGARSR